MNSPEPARPWWRQFGPGLLVTAAFIGPGTVATASTAGAQFGYELLWALLFAVTATIVLQEMAARLGLVTRQGLAKAMRSAIPNRTLRTLSLGLVITAVALGNAAYQTGNLTGAALGLSLLTGWTQSNCVLATGLLVLALLSLGVAKGRLQSLLVALVLLMSVAFLLTAMAVKPAWNETLQGFTAFRLPAGSLLTVIALIGTTVVPYNLFLHATAVQQQWPDSVGKKRAISEARWDATLSILLGGLVTSAIVITAATVFAGRNSAITAAELSLQLEPLLGSAGKGLFALGMLAAGITSGLTAPLAAGIAVSDCIDTTAANRSRVVTTVALLVATIGVSLAYLFGASPRATIVVAQAANGLLLPLVAGFLLLVMNRRSLLGEYTNGWMANLLGTAVVLVTLGLGVRSLAKLF